MTASAAERRDRAPLDRERVVRAAVGIADADGAGALSMRNLARHLGYEVMSLYNHVANKDQLLALMVDEVAGEMVTPDPDVAPLTAVRTLA
ncbi:MAG: TetR family transcriptional regulator, partial [Actinomycetota bacterium]